MDLSEVTGEEFYSGDFEDIKSILSLLNIEEGKLAKVQQPDVNGFQEMVDRDIDAILEDTYDTPLRAMNQIQPDGTTKRVFPGDVRRAARYWAASLLILDQFQQLSQDLTDQATEYVTDSRRSIFAMKRFTHRIPHQRRKSNLSHTMPPNLQPPSVPEADF